jgi:hypothetical protein
MEGFSECKAIFIVIKELFPRLTSIKLILNLFQGIYICIRPLSLPPH